MNQEKSLEKVVVELDFPFESDWKYPTGERHKQALPKSIRNLTLLGRILEKLRRGGKLAVEFDVPRAVKKGLETGEYVRKGGVIVTSDGHKVVHWLKEARAVRIGKAVSVLTIFVEIWSEYVLNEKLKQIQAQLDRMEELIKAEYYSTFLDAHDSLKAAIEANDPEYRITLLRESRSLFQTARNKTRILINEKVRKIDHQFRRFDDSWFDNRKEIKAIYSELGDIAEHAESAIHCYRAESRILERLEEFPLASRIATDALDFQLDVHQYLSFFADGTTPYTDLQLIQDANLDLKKGGQGSIHSRVKELHATDVLIPQMWLVKKVIGSITAEDDEDVFWVDEQGVTHTNKPNVMCLPDWLYEQHRPLQKNILAIENRLPVGVFELTE